MIFREEDIHMDLRVSRGEGILRLLPGSTKRVDSPWMHVCMWMSHFLPVFVCDCECVNEDDVSFIEWSCWRDRVCVSVCGCVERDGFFCLCVCVCA